MHIGVSRFIFLGGGRAPQLPPNVYAYGQTVQLLPRASEVQTIMPQNVEGNFEGRTCKSHKVLLQGNVVNSEQLLLSVCLAKVDTDDDFAKANYDKFNFG